MQKARELPKIGGIDVIVDVAEVAMVGHIEDPNGAAEFMVLGPRNPENFKLLGELHVEQPPREDARAASRPHPPGLRDVALVRNLHFSLNLAAPLPTDALHAYDPARKILVIPAIGNPLMPDFLRWSVAIALVLLVPIIPFLGLW